MPDSVFDTSFVRLANDSLFGEKKGNLLNRRLTALRQVADRRRRVRYNSKLLNEYLQHVREHRNDVIDQFFAMLDSPEAIKVSRSSLSRQDMVKASKCRWPSHDQHILAAAIGGDRVVIHVTEGALGCCAKGVKQLFGISVDHVA